MAPYRPRWDWEQGAIGDMFDCSVKRPATKGMTPTAQPDRATFQLHVPVQLRCAVGHTTHRTHASLQGAAPAAMKRACAAMANACAAGMAHACAIPHHPDIPPFCPFGRCCNGEAGSL
eukprot:163206-Chlamydomonas_euryale.AAC.11